MLEWRGLPSPRNLWENGRGTHTIVIEFWCEDKHYEENRRRIFDEFEVEAEMKAKLKTSEEEHEGKREKTVGLKNSRKIKTEPIEL
jgi:hypothetical protein